MNKKTLLTLGLFVAAALPRLSFGADHSDDFPQRVQMTPVEWVGTFGCEEKAHGPEHSRDHRCDLRFVTADGEAWQVRRNERLEAVHRNADGPVVAKIAAAHSPRYLLGGNFIGNVQRIEVLADQPVPERVSETRQYAPDMNREPSYMRR